MKMINFKAWDWKYRFPMLTLLIAAVGFTTSCGDDDSPSTGGTDDVVGEVTAVFSSSADGLTLTFVNASVNATTFEWDFGDGNSSADENPTHTYTSAGSYDVTLTASNSENSAMVTNVAITLNGGPLASLIVGKTWIPARGSTAAYALGPVASGTDIAGETWDYTNGLWFNWGDIGSGQLLFQRLALANDEYAFNVDGSYTVDFNGDFWAEFGLWGDTEFNETALDVTGGTLPPNADGVDMSAFATGSWDFVVDEDNSTITVSGQGAHILNPRIVGADRTNIPAHTLTPQASSVYEITKVVEGDVADTLVIAGYANDGANDIAQYIVMHSYHNEVDIPEMTCVITRNDVTVNATDIAHGFAQENGSTGLATINNDYLPEYGVEIAGQTATKFEIWNPAYPNVFGNLFLRAGTIGECIDGSESYVGAIDFANTASVVKFDVYIPSEGNDFTTSLMNSLVVRMVDESQYAQFWNFYILITKTDLATDTWLSLEYDFGQPDDNGSLLSDAITAGTTVPDAIHIDFGGDDHDANGVFYIKNFRIE